MRFWVVFLVVLVGTSGLVAAPIQMSPERTDQTAYVANGVLKLQGEKSDPITLFLMDYATSVVESTPNGGAESLVKNLQWMEDTFRRNERLAQGTAGTTEYSRFRRSAVNFLLELGRPALPIPVALIKSSVDLVETSVDFVQKPQKRLDAAVQQSGMWRHYGERASWVLGEYHSRAKQDARLKRVDAVLFAPRLGASVDDSAYAIVEKNPRFKQDRILDQLFQFIGPGAGLEQQFSTLQALSKAQGERILSAIEKNRLALNFLVQYVEDEEALKRKALGKQKELEASQEKVSSLNASIFALSSLIGLEDPRASRLLAASWEAGMRVNEAFKSFRKSAAQGGGFQGSALLTGDIIGAFTSLVGIFGQDPTVALLHEVLRQLEDLRRQVIQFQQAMRLHFDHVDGRLNGIYDSLERATQTLSHRAGLNGEKIISLERQLSGLSREVNALDLNLRAYLSQASDEEIRALEMVCLKRSERGSEVDYGAFTECLNQLEVCAVESATGPTRAGVSRSFFEESTLDLSRVGQKLSLPLDRGGLFGSSHWLESFIVPTQEALSHLGVGVSPGPLPNATIWGSCASTYRAVILENLDYHKYGSKNQGLAAIRTVGNRMRDYRLSIQNQGRAPYQKLLNEYRQSLVTLREEIAALVKGVERLAVESYSLVGGPDQEVGAPEAVLFSPTLYPCSDYKMHSGLPDAIRPFKVSLSETQRRQYYQGVARRFKVAHHLKLGRFEVCIESVRWEEPRVTELSREKRAATGNPERGSLTPGYTEIHQALSGRPTLTIRETFRTSDGGLYRVEKTRVTWGAPKTWGVRRLDRRGGSEVLRWQREDVSLFETVSNQSALSEAVASRKGVSLISGSVKAATAEVVGQRVNQLFSKTTQAILPMIAPGGKLSAPLDRITGAQALLLAAVTLAMPESLNQNDKLRSSFFGEHELLDGATIGELVREGALAGDPLWLKLALSRADTLEKTMDEVLSQSGGRFESEPRWKNLNADLLVLERLKRAAVGDITRLHQQLVQDVDAALAAQ